jgi:hypothetical protein
MNRRLYFLAPDPEHARRIVGDLETAGVRHNDIHALANDDALVRDLPSTTRAPQQDIGLYVERRLWDLNLIAFMIALAVLVTLLIKGLTGWAVIPLAVVISTFVVAVLFTRIPNAHVHEFREALRHGEILLMVDISRSRVAEIEDLVHHRHPEAVIGGVGWASKTLHV